MAFASLSRRRSWRKRSWWCLLTSRIWMGRWHPPRWPTLWASPPSKTGSGRSSRPRPQRASAWMRQWNGRLYYYYTILGMLVYQWAKQPCVDYNIGLWKVYKKLSQLNDSLWADMQHILHNVLSILSLPRLTCVYSPSVPVGWWIPWRAGSKIPPHPLCT